MYFFVILQHYQSHFQLGKYLHAAESAFMERDATQFVLHTHLEF